MDHKALMLRDCANDFAVAVSPFETGPDGKLVPKGRDMSELSEAKLILNNPYGIVRAKDLLLERVYAFTQAAGVEDDEALCRIVYEIAYQTEAVPELRKVDIKDFNALAQWLAAPGALPLQSKHAATAIKLAHNELGFDPIW